MISVPPVLAGRINYSPALPYSRDAIFQHMPMGSVIKVPHPSTSFQLLTRYTQIIIMYQRAFWREKGFSGEILTDSYPLSLVYDDSFPDPDKKGAVVPALVMFIAGKNARKWAGAGTNKPEGVCEKEWSKRHNELRGLILNQLAGYLGKEALDPVAYMIHDWQSEEYSRGCYVANVVPGVSEEVAAALRQPCGKIHWCGTETASRWIGYVEGALDSGERVSAEVLQLPGVCAARGKLNAKL